MSSTSSASVEVITRGLPRSNALGIAGKRADRENRLFVFDELLPLLGLDAQFVRAFKITAPGDDLHAAHFRERRHAAAQVCR